MANKKSTKAPAKKAAVKKPAKKAPARGGLTLAQVSARQEKIVAALGQLAGMVDDMPPLPGDGNERGRAFVAAVKELG
jgi:hypothetical protein